VPSPNSNFDQIASSTLRNYLNNKFTDNVFNGHPFYAWMIKNGRKVVEDGGEFLVEPLMFDNNNTTRWMSGYDTLSTDQQDGLTAAQFNWKMAGGAVTYSVLEDAKNSGRHQVINLLNAKIDQCKNSMIDMFDEDLFLDGSADSNNAITGLGAMVETGTYGNIAGATYTWWNAYEENTAGVLNESDMRTAFNTVARNRSHPDIIITTQTLFEKYESLVLPSYRTENLKMADLGFTNLAFKGVPIIYDDFCPSGVMFFLNSEYMKLRVSKGNDFVWTDKREPTNQFVFSMLTRWIGNLTCSARRYQGKLTARTAS